MVVQSEQIPLFQAEATWFHVFRSMVESGDVAKLGPYAVTVYLVIKTYANYSTGTAFPGIDLISEKSGISVRQVKTCLQTLEDAEYITKKKQGRGNIYTLREKVEIQGPDGRPEAVATWDYIPKHVKSAQAELKNFILTGQDADAKIIHIERLNLMIGDHNTQVNFNAKAELAKIADPELRKMLEQVINRTAEG